MGVVVLILGLSLFAQSAETQRGPADQQTLIGLEQRWNDAVLHNDAAFVATILADDFSATYDDGSGGDKARELALVEAFDQQVESAVQDDFRVRIYGTTAVVSFALHLTGIRQGQRADVTIRYTDVWVTRGGKWLCVATQSTRVIPKSPG
jgi:ketosteroid isomerase-like protein